MRKNIIFSITALSLIASTALFAYPLDGEPETGIQRLEGYRLAQEASSGKKLVAGQLWNLEEIKLNLVDYKGPDFDALTPDPELSASLNSMLSKRDPSYSMVLVDFRDSENIRWAGLRPDIKQNPGSVGKVLCMTALFHALGEVFPSTEERATILKTVSTKAGDWISKESHKVPKWDDQLKRNVFSVITPADEFRLSEWVDHAISPSANGAGAIIWREAMVVKHFGKAYATIDDNARKLFFKETPKTDLAALARAVITEPLSNAGINTSNLQQGSFFTANGKQKVPGIISFGTTRELARLLFRIEQGKLIDEWSSLQIKKYMYLTKKRYRYAFAPELDNSAIFFKSGSFYSCQQDPNMKCGKYMGNKQNLMNSIAIVEGSQEASPKYIATLMSNVLGVNSAWDHSRIGAATDKMMSTGKTQALKENASEGEINDAGKSE